MKLVAVDVLLGEILICINALDKKPEEPSLAVRLYISGGNRKYSQGNIMMMTEKPFSLSGSLEFMRMRNERFKYFWVLVCSVV
jgi:hypothetical protein